MEFREVRDRERARIVAGVLAMQQANSLEDTAVALVDTAMAVVPSDHGGYSEVDVHFGRTRLFSSEKEIEDWVDRKLPVWQHFMSSHPVFQYRTAHPDIAVVRLSDVADLTQFYNSGLYNELFREVETNHQLVMHLGFDPQNAPAGGPETGALPLTLGVPLNRKGSDFTRRDIQTLALLQQLAGPVLRRKRGEHQLRLLDLAKLTPDLQRSLMGLRLTERQAEIAFWMLKGKSNTDIGTILDIGAQTVRQHSMAIYRRLGVNGRLALQRTVLRSVAGVD